MSRDGSILLDFGDGAHAFRLAWGELIKLQEERDMGPYVIYDRLKTYTWMVQDIAAVIRLGLIGGGMKPADAIKLVREYVEARPPMENLDLALRVIGAGLAGVPEEQVGKKSRAASREGNGNQTSPTESSDLPPYTAMES